MAVRDMQGDSSNRMSDIYTCKRCGQTQGFTCSGRCRECGSGLLAGFSKADGPCMVSGCDRERVTGRYLSDGMRFVYECSEHARKGRRFDWSKDE